MLGRLNWNKDELCCFAIYDIGGANMALYDISPIRITLWWK